LSPFSIRKDAHFTFDKQEHLIINQLQKHKAYQHSTFRPINIQHFRLAKYLQKTDYFLYFG